MIKKIGPEKVKDLILDAKNRRSLYQGITERLLFAPQRYERMDMAFLAKIAAIDYGAKYRVMLVSLSDSSRLDEIAVRIREKYDIFFTTIWKELLISILPEKMAELSEIRDLYYFIEENYGTLKISASSIKYHLEDSHIGLQEALRTYDMIDTMKKYKEDLMFYEDLGIFGLLYDLKETTVFENFYNGVFQDIWDYDEKNDAHLFETLACYFKNECNKAKTAEEMFIHENTLRYRLRQIEEILGRSLKNVNTIADIVTALNVRRMMQILDKL